MSLASLALLQEPGHRLPRNAQPGSFSPGAGCKRHPGHTKSHEAADAGARDLVAWIRKERKARQWAQRTRAPTNCEGESKRFCPGCSPRIEDIKELSSDIAALAMMGEGLPANLTEADDVTEDFLRGRAHLSPAHRGQQGLLSRLRDAGLIAIRRLGFRV